MNAACHNLLWERGYGWCCASPPCRASSSSLFLGVSAAYLQLLAGVISSVGHTGFFSCTHFCTSPSLLLSYHINETCSPPPKLGPVLLFPCPLLKIVFSTVVALTCCLNSEAKIWWKYPDVCIAEVNASVKTTQGACRYYVRVCCFCESLEGSQTGTSKVDASKVVFKVEGFQGSASLIEGT